MNDVIGIMIKELKNLQGMLLKLERRIADMPDMSLRISNKNDRTEYYYKIKGETGNGKYIRKQEIELASKIAQRDYDEKIIRCIKEKIELISTFIKKYNALDERTVYENENNYRKNLLYDPILNDENYIKSWQQVKYGGKAFVDGVPEIITERGERVRSKSEKIIADKLYYLGIPYRYEYPLRLNNGLVIYPDFTILNISTREEVYLEHFGMMDDKDYFDSALLKINTYTKNGIYPGVKIFYTYESSKFPLDSRMLDGMLRTLFIDN